MKNLKEMDLLEAESAYEDALRNLPHDAHIKIVKDSCVRKGDSPQLAHTKDAFRRLNKLKALA